MPASRCFCVLEPFDVVVTLSGPLPAIRHFADQTSTRRARNTIEITLQRIISCDASFNRDDATEQVSQTSNLRLIRADMANGELVWADRIVPAVPETWSPDVQVAGLRIHSNICLQVFLMRNDDEARPLGVVMPVTKFWPIQLVTDRYISATT
jgi:hypothetical protein